MRYVNLCAMPHVMNKQCGKNSPVSRDEKDGAARSRAGAGTAPTHPRPGAAARREAGASGCGTVIVLLFVLIVGALIFLNMGGDNEEEEGVSPSPAAEPAQAGRMPRSYQEHEARQYDESVLAGEMVLVPGGAFRMGDLSGAGKDNERPAHNVTVPSFMIGKHEVTFAQWDACVEGGGCRSYRPHDEGWGRDNRPVIHVSWNDVQSFIGWLNRHTGGGYRLPTEAEWEYAARADGATIYSWGNNIVSNKANCDGCRNRSDGDQTTPVGSFAANAWSLHDMPGNVFEWVEDCWHRNYQGAPANGSEWRSDCDDDGYYSRRVIRGGSWYSYEQDLRSASRYGTSPTVRRSDLGFRLARDIQGSGRGT